MPLVYFTPVLYLPQNPQMQRRKKVVESIQSNVSEFKEKKPKKLCRKW